MFIRVWGLGCWGFWGLGRGFIIFVFVRIGEWRGFGDLVILSFTQNNHFQLNMLN